MKNTLSNLALLFCFIGMPSAFADHCDVMVPVHAKPDLIEVLKNHHYNPIYDQTDFRVTVKDISKHPGSHRAKFKISMTQMDAKHPVRPATVAEGEGHTYTWRQNWIDFRYRVFRKAITRNKGRAYDQALADFDDELNGHDCF